MAAAPGPGRDRRERRDPPPPPRVAAGTAGSGRPCCSPGLGRDGTGGHEGVEGGGAPGVTPHRFGGHPPPPSRPRRELSGVTAPCRAPLAPPVAPSRPPWPGRRVSGRRRGVGCPYPCSFPPRNRPPLEQQGTPPGRLVGSPERQSGRSLATCPRSGFSLFPKQPLQGGKCRRSQREGHCGQRGC